MPHHRRRRPRRCPSSSESTLSRNPGGLTDQPWDMPPENRVPAKARPGSNGVIAMPWEVGPEPPEPVVPARGVVLDCNTTMGSSPPGRSTRWPKPDVTVDDVGPDNAASPRATV